MKYKLFLALIISAGLAHASSQSEMILKAETPIELSGKGGSFDFMGIDVFHHRLLAAHTGAQTLEVLDLKTGKPLPSVSVGHAQGVASDPNGRMYFLGNEKDKNIVFVNAETLTKAGEVKVDGPVDAIAFDPKNGMLYAAQDDGEQVWVIDVKSKAVVAHVKIPGTPEVIEYDPKTDRLYLNIKNKDVVVRIDPLTNKVDATWSTLPATSPHGLAIDAKNGRIYSAGRNGQVVSMDISSGKVLSSSSIAEGTDQIAFDSSRGNLYCASKMFVSVVDAKNLKLKFVANVPSPKSAHTMAVDPKSHDVWISYADEQHSYLQKYKLTQ
jgi:DNA-binding beta-propeller fold protein YncE